MKTILSLITACLLVACSSSSEGLITSTLTTNKGSSWVYSCDKGSYECNVDSVRNSRTMYMGNQTYYICGIDGQLYMSRETYNTSSNLTPLKGVTCKFEVTQNN